jgi:hypothetical protein
MSFLPELSEAVRSCHFHTAGAAYYQSFEILAAHHGAKSRTPSRPCAVNHDGGGSDDVFARWPNGRYVAVRLSEFASYSLTCLLCGFPPERATFVKLDLSIND